MHVLLLDVYIKLQKKTKTEIDNTVIEVIEGPLKFLPVVIGFFIATSYIELKPELLSFIASYNESRFTAIEARLTALEGS